MTDIAQEACDAKGQQAQELIRASLKVHEARAAHIRERTPASRATLRIAIDDLQEIIENHTGKTKHKEK
ncbi:hypothetical protein FJZ28_01130 [Candidatus Peregrinibacteria bacterium]|nr:hypothetical protein [Candidatus Peregrinibacteria bacterium]